MTSYIVSPAVFDALKEANLLVRVGTKYYGEEIGDGSGNILCRLVKGEFATQLRARIEMDIKKGESND